MWERVKISFVGFPTQLNFPSKKAGLKQALPLFLSDE
jgi:hypothetical protein